MTAPVVLVRAGDVVAAGRVLAQKAGPQYRVELATGATVKLAREHVLLQLQSVAGEPAVLHRLIEAARLPEDEVEAAWTLLDGQPVGFAEVARLLLGKADADARDRVALFLGLQDDGFYVAGGQLHRRTAEQRAAWQQERQAKALLDAEIAPWRVHLDRFRAGWPAARSELAGLVGRLQARVTEPTVADPAVDRLLEHVGREGVGPIVAAADLLRELGAWDPHEDLDLVRSGLLQPWPGSLVATLPREAAPDAPTQQLDLPFVTIDNEAPHEVDDAVWAESLPPGPDGQAATRVWIAIAHPGCWLPQGSPGDLEAMRRGATLYHPRHVVGMLPDALSREVASLLPGVWRPALVFAATIDGQGRRRDESVTEAQVRVAGAWSYADVDAELAGHTPLHPIDRPLLDRLLQATLAHEAERIRNGAYLLYKADVDVRARPHQPVEIRDASQTSPGRRMVTEAMVMCGAIAGRYAANHNLPAPFRVQGRPQMPPLPPGLYHQPVEVYSILRTLQPARTVARPEPHGVLGLDAYLQVSSPLRRFGDVLGQRQIVSHLRGQPPAYSAPDLLSALQVAEAGQAERRQWQRRGDRYFKLVYLAGKGAGTRLHAQLVRALPGQGLLLAFVPALGLEVPVGGRGLKVGDQVDLMVRAVVPTAGELRVTVA